MTDPTDHELGQSFLNGIFQHLSAEIEVAPKGVQDGALVYELTGSIDSLQRSPDLVSAVTLLTAQAVSRSTGERANCLLDVGGTFEARRTLLATAASDIARAVKTTGRRAVFDNLSSSERRIVHTHLRDDESVETRSEGEERGRLLIVEPKQA